jgi:4-amino-4-deoxy-L-arabinose transferase-like glycosyltransferase
VAATRAGGGAAAAIRRRPDLAALAAVVVAVGAFQFWISPENPPGFIRDEASFALNAHTLSQSLRDQDGARAPLFFTSFLDYKPPVYPYLLAGVFRVTGPEQSVARGVAAAAVLVAVLLVGLLAWRLTRSALVTGASVVLAGTTPWLFELGRVAFDTALTPLAVLAVLVATEAAHRTGTRPVLRGAAVGAALGVLAYTYASGRLLAPLYAAALIVFLRRPGFRFLASAWTTLALAALPMATYAERHQGALTARWEATRFADEGTPLAGAVWQAVRNYLADVNVWRWVRDGDPKPYIHTWGAGQLYAGTVVLAAASLVLLVRRRRTHAWWAFVVLVLLLTPVPAALTEDRLHSLRLAPWPAILSVLAIPAVAALAEHARRATWARAAAAALVAVTAVHLADFLHVYTERGRSSRLELFEANVPHLLGRAFRDGDVYVDFDDRYAITHAQWYAVSRGLGLDRVVRLSDGAVAPVGATVFGRFQECDYRCERVAEADTYWVARALGPREP